MTNSFSAGGIGTFFTRNIVIRILADDLDILPSLISSSKVPIKAKKKASTIPVETRYTEAHHRVEFLGGRLMRFSKSNNIYKVVRITGSQDNILGIYFFESDENNIDLIK